MFIRVVAIIVFISTFGVISSAQSEDRLNFGGGAGFTVPTDRAGNRLNTGWNVNLRGGVNLTQQFLADLDFTYTNSRFNDTTLAEFNEPDGGLGIWSLTFNPVVRLAPHNSKIQPYITAGYGLYHLNFTLTRPTTVLTILCDPFFGFCFPGSAAADQVVASNSTYKGGVNAGGGIDIPIGESRMKLFAEARYHRMFTSHGSDLTYIPVTFGVRW